MSGKIKVLVMDTTLIYFLISMKKILSFVQLSIRYVLLVQSQDNVLPSEFLKKNGESGEVSFLKAEKFLENLLSTEVKNNGLKLGRV